MSVEFSKSITKCIDLAAELSLLLQCGPANSLSASEEFKKAARRVSYYRELYDCGAVNQDFNVMLKDLSYFQFTEERDGEVRLAYYPNPYSFIEYQSEKKLAGEMLEQGEISDSEFDQLISEGNFTCDIPLIRYDYSPKQYCNKYHPSAHFHIGFKADNRWPVKRILTPIVFFLKILTNYYGSIWKAREDAAGINLLDLRYREEVKECALIGVELFSAEESQRLHFV